MINIENLKIAREKKNITQAELAKKLFLSVQTISNYETGLREPDLKTLKKISVILNVSTDYLLGMKSYEYNIDYSMITKLTNEQKTEIIMYILDIISKTENL